MKTLNYLLERADRIFINGELITDFCWYEQCVGDDGDDLCLSSDNYGDELEFSFDEIEGAVNDDGVFTVTHEDEDYQIKCLILRPLETPPKYQLI